MIDPIPSPAISPLRQRLIDDMNMRRFSRETQRNYIRDVGRFAFSLKVDAAGKDDFPSLPLLLSLIDTAIDRNESLSGPNTTMAWDKARLLDVRRSLEYLIFAVLQHALAKVPADNPYDCLLELVHNSTGLPPLVVSLNYDLLVDHAMMQLASKVASQSTMPAFPEFGCDIATDAVRQRNRFGTLLKIHGSLDFLYCPGCHRLDVALSSDGLHLVKALGDLFQQQPSSEDLHSSYSCQGWPCHEPGCRSSVLPIVITPTALKDYRNPHVSRIWYETHRQLRQADRVIFVGYSMPSDDVHVAYLLKRSLGHLAPGMITVVESDAQKRRLSEHPVGRQYRALFGDGIDWRTEGFGGWVERLRSENVDVVTGRLHN